MENPIGADYFLCFYFEVFHVLFQYHVLFACIVVIGARVGILQEIR